MAAALQIACYWTVMSQFVHHVLQDSARIQVRTKIRSASIAQTRVEDRPNWLSGAVFGKIF